MASIIDPQPDLPASEELVAYLDGELSPEECRRIEQRLAADADYRQQLRELDQAWEALDVLPNTTADDHFAHTTIEMVAVAAQQELSQDARNAAAARRRRMLLWSAGGLAAAVVGFAVVRTMLRSPNDALLADLPVIRQVDLLSQVDDVEFLRNLPAAVPLEQLAHDQAAIDRELADLAAAAAPSRDQRRRWLVSRSPEEKANLAAQAKRFEELAQRNPGEAARLKQLEREIHQAEDADQLKATIVAYNRWLVRRSPGDREDLRLLAADERIRRVRDIVRYEDEEAARHLSADDKARLRDEIFEIYDDRKSDFRRAMRRRDRDNRPFLEGPRPRLALMVLHWELRNDHRDDRTSERLIKQLSPEAREYWKDLRHRKRSQLLQWVSEAMRPRWGPEELEQFFTEELNTNQRERLLSLPADQMQTELERLFVAKRLGLPDWEQWLGEFGETGGYLENLRGRPGWPPQRPGDDKERRDSPPPERSDQDRKDRDGREHE